MEWRYKTVHYAVKKDGLLGGSFLDEEEMESSLNDYGEQGWELVSLLEVRDGVVAVFKQEKDLFKGGRLAEIIPQKDDECLGDIDTIEDGENSYSTQKTHLQEKEETQEYEGDESTLTVVPQSELEHDVNSDRGEQPKEKEMDRERTFAEIKIE